MTRKRVSNPTIGIVATTVITVVVVLVGCQRTDVPTQKFSSLHFSHLKPLVLDVSSVEFISRYSSPLKEPNVEHLMTISPERAASQWVHDRLAITGNTSYQAIFLIRQAPVVKRQLVFDRGMLGFLKKEQAEYYEARLDVSLEIREARTGKMLSEATTTVDRSRTVSEDITTNERDTIWLSMVEALIMDMDSTLEGAIHRYLDKYLVKMI